MDVVARQFREMAPHRAILRAVEARLMGAVPLVPPVLDVGCGDGHFADVAYSGRSIDVGVDLRRQDLREARGRAGVYRSVVATSATELPFADGTFATVVSNCVIEHVPSLERALAEIRRVLRPPSEAEPLAGGFATTVPSDRFAEDLLGASLCRRLGLAGAARRYGAFFNRISRHYHVMSAEGWTRTLERAGFVVEEARPYFSAAAHRRFDLCHYLGVPNLATRVLFGRWVVHPAQGALFERWLRPYVEEPLPEQGAYVFLRARRRD